MKSRRPTAALVALGVVLLLGVPAAFLFVGSPGTATVPSGAVVDHVVIVGAAGLRWEDVTRDATPNLWRLAGRAAVGSLVVRSAQEYTCPADGWLTVGAGNRARVTTERIPDGCARPLPTVVPDSGGGAMVVDQRDVLEDNENLTYRARPGVLAELVDCTVAVGRGAALAAARPGVGRVDQYLPRLPENPGVLFGSCPLSIVDAGTVTGKDRRTQARRVDAVLARVMDARPARSLVVVAGVADVFGPAHLHVAMVEGPGYRAGVLNSGRVGYLRLTDLAPTAVRALGLSHSKWFSGAAPSVTPSAGAEDTSVTVRRLVDADRSASQQPHQGYRFGIVLVVSQVLLYLAAIPVLWRIRRAAATAEDSERLSWTAAERVLEVAAVAAALLLPAAMLSDLVPWWRTGAPGTVLAAVILGVVAALTVLVRAMPWWRKPLGPVVSVAALGAGTVAADLFTGGTLQLDSVAGHSAVEGGRLAGLSALGAGVFAVGVLLCAGYVAQRMPRRHAPLAVALIGGAGVLVAGAPGMDPGSAIALAAGVALAVVTCTGNWLTAHRLLGVAVVGAVVAAGFVLLSIYPSPEHRSRLGRFFTDVAEGVPGALIHRTAEANVITFVSSPLTPLVVAGALFVGLVLVQPSGGLMRVFGLYPALRAGLFGSVVAAVLGGVVDGAAASVLGAAAAVAVPQTVLACLRALARAHLRTAPEMPPAAVAAELVTPG
jgi:hypothetical protein